VEWLPQDIAQTRDWGPFLQGVEIVVNLAWYRWESAETFRRLADSLVQLVEASERAGIRRFIQVSVPAAPPSLETDLPYLAEKRRVDGTLASSRLSFRILRPTMLFGPGDVLLGEMVRLMHRYRVFPMFGDGSYHVSPVAVADLAEIVRRECAGTDSGTIDIGGPERFEYRALTDRMFMALGRRPRYWTMSPAGALRLTRLMVRLGSTLLYPYEVEWLVSDRLGLPSYGGLDRPMIAVGPYLDEIARLGRAAASPA